MAYTKIQAAAMSKRNFRKIVEALLVERPGGTTATAITKEIRDGIAPHDGAIRLDPETGISDTPEGVPFCKFVVKSDDGEPSAKGAIYWDERDYALKAVVTDAPEGILEKGTCHEIDGRGADARAAATRYYVKSLYPDAFPDEWPDGQVPIYVYRDIIKALCGSCHRASHANVGRLWAGIRKYLEMNTDIRSNLVINWLAFESGNLCRRNVYDEARTDALWKLRFMLTPGGNRLSDKYFTYEYFADPETRWTAR